MELTRRDALAALTAVGGAGGLALGYSHLAGDSPGGDDPSDDHVVDTFVAVAEVLYPSELSGVRDFVETFLRGRLDDGDHARGLREAVAALDAKARSWYDGRTVELSPASRDTLLVRMGADTAAEHPDGTVPQRVRYFVVNELLLALYSSPTGGELVGIENPQGHAGGIESYRRGPTAAGNGP